MSDPEFERIIDQINTEEAAKKHGWLPIDSYPIPTNEWQDRPPSVLVDNGERVGEAVLSTDYGAWDGDDIVPWRWAWTHHSTCGCCHYFMDPQPKWWQPLPAPAPKEKSDDSLAQDS